MKRENKMKEEIKIDEQKGSKIVNSLQDYFKEKENVVIIEYLLNIQLNSNEYFFYVLFLFT